MTPAVQLKIFLIIFAETNKHVRYTGPRREERIQTIGTYTVYILQCVKRDVMREA
jgi:hypothetical protein